MNSIRVDGFFILSFVGITLPEELGNFLYLNDMTMDDLNFMMTDPNQAKRVSAKVVEVYNSFYEEATRQLLDRISQAREYLTRIEKSPESFIATAIDNSIDFN